MVFITVAGVAVHFPFEPYDVQLEYMERVLEALEGSTNALLESPTGTGKTLCILCATIAWVLLHRGVSRHTIEISVTPDTKVDAGHAMNRGSTALGRGDTGGRRRPGVTHKIVYCSRTHAQLAQVIRELKRTEYKNHVSMALLGSREHMCVNSEVTRLPSRQAQQSMCNALRADRSCRFFRGLQATRTLPLTEACRIHDLEELVHVGRRCGFCPYYFEREAAEEADVVFMPYNYVLDSALRHQLPFDLKHCVLVIDEAHNLPSVLSAAGCVNLQPLDLTNAIHDCTRAIAAQRLAVQHDSHLTKKEGALREQEIASLKILLCRLEACIAQEKMTRPAPSATAGERTSDIEDKFRVVALPGPQMEFEVVRTGLYMFEFLAKALITRDVFHGGTGGAGGMSDAMNKAITLLAETERPAGGLVRVQQFLDEVFVQDADYDLGATRFVLQEPQEKNTAPAVGVSSSLSSSSAASPSLPTPQPASTRRVLGFWKLDNSSELLALSHQLHCMLLTSGTLSPLDHFAAELGIPFPVRLQGSHVVGPEQVLGSVLCRGPAGERLNGSYALRGGVDYRRGLGMSVLNLCRHTPGGMLVFFPSYLTMHAAVDLWQAGTSRTGCASPTVWGLLNETKPIFVEPADGKDLGTVVTEFKRAVDEHPRRGAVLLAVCRGKVSEGVDFADNQGRCVLVTGIPYANHTDLFVRLKRAYYTEVAPHRPLVHGRCFTGEDWYRNEAMRAVNQCIGRVIRHRDDFGAVVLADERFAGLLDSLSSWVACRTTVHHEFRETNAAVAHFFAVHDAQTTSSVRRTGDAAVDVISSWQKEWSESDELVVGNVTLPESVTAARAFAAASARAAQAAREDELRRQVLEVREGPGRTLPTPQTSVASHLSSPRHSPEGSEGAQSTAPSIALTMERQTLAHLGSTMQATACTRLGPGPTSREFSTYLKARLTAPRYDAFKSVLQGIASCRDYLPGAPSLVRARLSCAVQQLWELFSEATPDEPAALLTEFGRHIPEELRPFYAHLVRKRQRQDT